MDNIIASIRHRRGFFFSLMYQSREVVQGWHGSSLVLGIQAPSILLLGHPSLWGCLYLHALKPLNGNSLVTPSRGREREEGLEHSFPIKGMW